MTRSSESPGYASSFIALFILSLIRHSIASSAPPTLSMDTPPPIAQCASGTFTWQGGRPPYTLSVCDSHTGAPVFSNSGLTDTVFHWVAAVAAGTDLVVELTDTGVSGAGGGRLEDNFVVEEGSDACLESSSGTSSSTGGQASNTSASTPSTSTLTSGGQPTTSETVAPSPSGSPSPSPSDSTTVTPPTTEPSSSSSSTGTNGAPSQMLTITGSAGVTGSASESRTTPGGSSIGLATTSSSGRSTSTSTGGTSWGRAGAGTMIAGAAVGSLVAGFVLAAGLFCVWRARTGRARRDTRQPEGRWQRQRQRRGRLEPYEYPSADPDPTSTRPTSVTVAALPPPERENALDFDGGPDRPNANADPVVREGQGPGKSRRDDFLSPSIQPTPSQRADLVTLNGAESSRVMDGHAVDGAGGSQGLGIRTGDAVRRRWDLGDLDPDVEDAFRFDLADYSYSEYSGSTAPPPYSHIA